MLCGLEPAVGIVVILPYHSTVPPLLPIKSEKSPAGNTPDEILIFPRPETTPRLLTPKFKPARVLQSRAEPVLICRLPHDCPSASLTIVWFTTPFPITTGQVLQGGPAPPAAP